MKHVTNLIIAFSLSCLLPGFAFAQFDHSAKLPADRQSIELEALKSLVSLYWTEVHAESLTIVEARRDTNSDFIPDLFGDTVTVVGVVTTGNFSSTGTDYYIQDSTAGINLFSFSALSSSLNLGDRVRVTGKIDQFQGKTELVPLTVGDVILLSTGNPLPTPQVVTISQVGEATEGKLVRILSVHLVNAAQWPGAGSDANVLVSNGVDTLVMRIDKETNIDGSPPPSQPFNVVGIGNQFTTSIPPNNGYQILPRSLSDIVTGVENEPGIPRTFELSQNFPNPFNPSTRIRYSLPEKANVSLKVFNVLGQEVVTLVNDQQQAGNYVALFEANSLPSGVYFYRLEAGSFRQVKKMLLMM